MVKQNKKTTQTVRIKTTLLAKKEVQSIKISNKLLLITLAIITIAVYAKSINNKLTNWDDGIYISYNKNIQTLSGDSVMYTLKKTFHTYERGNYHPLTMLTYCIEYTFFKLNPKPYHITNILLHLLNTLLVFYFIWLLTKQQWVSFITALLFAIHPMHVESVAWVSERKDVLYSFFYLIGLCAYLLYVKSEKRSLFFYVLILFVFILAVLSKAMAVTLPIAFFAIDYFVGRKINGKVVIEKIPFILISIFFGIVAIIAQKSISALDAVPQYNIVDRVFLTCYSIQSYLWKFIVPVNLSCFYSYPIKENGMFPVVFYLAPLSVVAVLFLIYKSLRLGKDVLFGFILFSVTIALVLQVLPVGDAIIADRYTYLPYIGLSFILARWINDVIENRMFSQIKNYVFIIVGLFLTMCLYLSFQRSMIWRDSITLWNDAIEKSKPNDRLYDLRGDAYNFGKIYDKAIEDYSIAVKISKKNMNAYHNRGSVYYEISDYEKAINDFTIVINHYQNDKKGYFNPDTYYSAYSNRALAYSKTNQFENAIRDFTFAISYYKDDMNKYANRGLAYAALGKYDAAFKDYNYAILHDSSNATFYNYRGSLYNSLHRSEEAIRDFTSAIKINSTNPNPIDFFNRGLVYYYSKKYNEAIVDFSYAIKIKNDYSDPYYFRGLAYKDQNKHEEAISNFTSAIKYQSPYSEVYVNRAVLYYKRRDFDLAINDVLMAKKMGYTQADYYLQLFSRRGN